MATAPQFWLYVPKVLQTRKGIAILSVLIDPDCYNYTVGTEENISDIYVITSC